MPTETKTPVSLDETSDTATNNGTETVVAPPLPPTLKPPAIQRGKGPIQSVEYETTIKQTVRPSDNPISSAGSPNGDAAPAYTNLPGDYRRFAQLCWNLFNRKPDGWELRLTKITPPYEDNLPVPQGPYEDVIAYIHQLPHAQYRLRIKTGKYWEAGGGLDPIIDTRTDGEGSSPQQKVTRSIYANLFGQPPQVAAASINGMTPAELDVERTIRGFEQRNGQMGELERLQFSRRLLQERRATEEERRELERERAGGVNEMNRPLTEVTETLKAMRQEIASMKEAPKGPSMVELLTAMTPIITALIGSQSNKGAEVNQAINLIIETNKGMMQQQLEQLRDMKLTAERLIEKQSANPEAHIKMLLDMQEKGEERAMKMFELMRPQDDRDGDDVNIDPNNVWGSLAAEGVKALIGAFKSGGPEIVKMIADRVGKPPAAVTEQDLVALNARLRQMPTAQRPQQFMPGQPIQQVPARLPMAQNPPAPAALAPLATFDPTSAPLQQPQSEKGSEGVTAVVPPPESALNSAQTNVTPTQPEQPATAVSGASTSQQAIPAVPATDDLIERDLREFIDVCCREYMLVDLKTERQEHEWPYYATQKWHKDFKMKLVLVETHDQRMDILKEKADPILWQEIIAMWKKEGSGNFYNLQVAWNTFITETMKPPEAAASEATATAQPTGGQ